MIPAENEEQRLSKEKQSRYNSGVGVVLYLVKHSRPEISNSVRELSKVLDTSTETAYKEILRIINYVSETKTQDLEDFS